MNGYDLSRRARFNESRFKVLCDAYRKNNFIDPEVSEKLGVKRGLRNADRTGVLAGLTNICDVIGYQRDENNNIIPIDGKLIYRGIDLNDIVNEAITQDRFLFEEVAWLLLFGSLPNKETLDNFRRILETHRELPDGCGNTNHGSPFSKLNEQDGKKCSCDVFL